MKKYLLIITTIFLFIFNIKVYALCDDIELLSKMDEFKIQVIEDKDMMVNMPNLEQPVLEKAQYAYVLSFTPYSSDYIIRVTVDGESEFAKYTYKYNTYVIGSDIHYEPKKYIVEVFAAKGTACENERILARSYTVPAFNEFSASQYCDEHSDEDVCKINYDSSKMTEEDKENIVKKAENEKKEQNMTTYDKIMDFIKKSWLFVLIPVLIISLVYIVKISNYKKKESNR